MTGTFDPMKGQRLAPAWAAALELLRGGAFHRWTDVIKVMLDASDIEAKTANNLLRSGISHGIFASRGKYPNREIRL